MVTSRTIIDLPKQNASICEPGCSSTWSSMITMTGTLLMPLRKSATRLR